MRPRKRELEFLEKMVISKAWEKNNELINVHHVRHLRELVVPGLLGDYGRGTLTKEEQALRQVLGAWSREFAHFCVGALRGAGQRPRFSDNKQWIPLSQIRRTELVLKSNLLDERALETVISCRFAPK